MSTTKFEFAPAASNRLSNTSKASALTEDETILSDLPLVNNNTEEDVVNNEDVTAQWGADVFFWEDYCAASDDEEEDASHSHESLGGNLNNSLSSIIPLEVFQGSTTSIASDLHDEAEQEEGADDQNAAKHTRDCSESLVNSKVFDSLLAGMDTESETEDLQLREFGRKDVAIRSSKRSSKGNKRRSRSAPRKSSTTSSSSSKRRSGSKKLASGDQKSEKTRSSEKSRSSDKSSSRTSAAEKSPRSSGRKTRSSRTSSDRRAARSSTGSKSPVRRNHTSDALPSSSSKRRATTAEAPLRRSNTTDSLPTKQQRRTTTAEAPLRRSNTTESAGSQQSSKVKRTPTPESLNSKQRSTHVPSIPEPTTLKRAVTDAPRTPPRVKKCVLVRASTAPPEMQDKSPMRLGRTRGQRDLMKDVSSNSDTKASSTTRRSPSQRQRAKNTSLDEAGSRVRVNNRLRRSKTTDDSAAAEATNNNLNNETSEERLKRRRAYRRAMSERGAARREGSSRSLSPRRENSCRGLGATVSGTSPTGSRPRRNRSSVGSLSSATSSQSRSSTGSMMSNNNNSSHEPRSRYSRSRTLRCATSVLDAQLSQTVHNTATTTIEEEKSRELSEVFMPPTLKESMDAEVAALDGSERSLQEQEREEFERERQQVLEHARLALETPSRKKKTFGLGGVVKAAKNTTKAATKAVRESLLMPSLTTSTHHGTTLGGGTKVMMTRLGEDSGDFDMEDDGTVSGGSVDGARAA